MRCNTVLGISEKIVKQLNDTKGSTIYNLGYSFAK